MIGTSGAGKTTTARQIASVLSVPHVELDTCRHGPSWTETPDGLFRDRLSEALRGDTWVADGNYTVAREVVWPRATTVVWLDYPIHLVAVGRVDTGGSGLYNQRSCRAAGVVRQVHVEQSQRV